MGELETFAGIGKDNGMVADHITSSDGVHSDFCASTFANHSLASVADIVVVVEVADFGEDLSQPAGRAARGVFFEVVMHFHDLEIEVLPEDLG